MQVCLKEDESSWLYEGYNIDGVREGKGRLILSSGNVYIGEWKNGYRHGFGKGTFANGDIYEGNWFFGK